MAVSVAQRRKEIENELMAMRREAEEMDAKIRAYLGDRDRKPHPRHQEFIERVQRYRVDPAASTKYLETMLDNLQWKVYYYSRAWQQLWDNADNARRQREILEKSSSAPSGPAAAQGGSSGENSRIYSVDRLWELQKQKLSALGENSAAETKEGFVQRIKERYGKLASEKKQDEEIVMKFDKKTRRCTLSLKKRNHVPEQ
ncbi:MAG: hypothetical protein K9J85_07670 [Desulfobacteraceae bacterium]|nr:hypothetical protein [Desulfobacteraceae bacterium]